MARDEERIKWHRDVHKSGGGGAVYGLGMIGALVYYLQHATTLGDGLFGILKALFWPGFVVFKLLEFLRM